MIYVETKRKALATIQKLHPNATIIDVTSRGEEPWIRVSPFYPHGDIPIPYSEGYFSASVEGVWQGLKVFEQEDVDHSKFRNDAMKGIKRTVRKLGKPLGHRRGVSGTELLDYATARRKIYLFTYGWMLEHKAADVISRLVDLAAKGDVVLLDYDTNGDLDNLRVPLSHAALVKRFIEKKYPHLAISQPEVPIAPIAAEKKTKKATPKGEAATHKKPSLKKASGSRKGGSGQLTLL